MPKKSNKNSAAEAGRALMATLVAATQNDGFVYTSDADRANLNPAFIVTNASMVDAQGKIATRASEAGIASMQPSAPQVTSQNGEAANATPRVKPVISAVVATSIPRPVKAKRGGHIKATYPFDSLPVDGSFFVAATAENENPAKVLASTASSATRRYMVADLDANGQKQYETVEVEKDGVKTTEQRVKMKKTRVFEVFPIEDGAPWGFAGKKGAGVWRTA